MRPDEKLLRLAALRPPSSSPSVSGTSHGYIAELPADAERLARLLGAEVESTPSGSCLVYRAWFPDPAPQPPAHSALRLLHPEAPEAATDISQWLFLDTETTGLAGGSGTYAFLVGIAWWEAGGFQVEQFFMRDFGEEQPVLDLLSRRLASRPVLFTFNGKSFDWPLLETRFRMTRVLDTPSLHAHFDLLHPSRNLWRLRLGSVRLCELERHILGRHRGPDISSALIPETYFSFIRGGPADPLVPIFEHNRMDLQGLAALSSRVISLLASPDGADEHPLDLYALSRLLERRGLRDSARRLYERAVAEGLPAEVERAARFQIARLAKRDGDLPLACSLWEDLSGETSEGLDAWEQLAMYYEHKAHQPEQALELTRAAIQGLGNAFQAGSVLPGKYRSMNVRLTRRLWRLESRVRELQPAM
jgi:uncharacterized protein YprB with RNaseH-like and TPR domain